MSTTQNPNADSNFKRSSLRSAIHEIIQESKRRRLVIRTSAGKQIFECSVLLAAILSVGAPVLPVFVILGVLVESISVSLEKK